jgi:hypothetical protein
VKCPIAPVTDEDAENLIPKAVRDELIDGIKEMVAAYQEV